MLPGTSYILKINLSPLAGERLPTYRKIAALYYTHPDCLKAKRGGNTIYETMKLKFLLRFVTAVFVCLILSAVQARPANAASDQNAAGLTAPADNNSPDLSRLPSLRVTSEKTQAYPGEVVPVTVKLEYPENLTVRDVQYPRLPHPGLLMRDAVPPSLRTEQRNGLSWSTMEFTYLISGEKAGTFILGPVTLTCSLLLPATTTSFQGFFAEAEPQIRRLKAEGVAFTVIPFPPEGKPEEFAGAVGDFRLSVAVEPREVRAGDPVTVTTTISGEGVMDTVVCPSVDAPGSFRVYQPQARRLREKTVCEQILLPVDETVRQIPPVAFSFFDPRRGSYRTVRTGPFAVTVSGAPGPKRVAIPPPFPVSSGATVARQAGVSRSAGFRACIPVVSGMALVVLLGLSIRQFRRRPAPSSSREEPEIIHQNTSPEPSLALVEAVLADTDSGQFHTEVFRTLQHCLGNHGQVAPQAITADFIETHLRPEENSELLIDMAQSLFDECDRVRYGGALVSREEREATYRRLKKLRCALEAGGSQENS